MALSKSEDERTEDFVNRDNRKKIGLEASLSVQLMGIQKEEEHMNGRTKDGCTEFMSGVCVSMTKSAVKSNRLGRGARVVKR